MKKGILYSIIVFLLLFSPSIFGIPILNNTNEAYNYWAKRGIMEMVYADMKDYSEKKGNSITDKEKKIISDYLKKYDSNIDSIPNEKMDSNFESFFHFLESKKWDNERTLQYQLLINKFNNNIPLNDQFFAIKSVDYKHSLEVQKKILDSYNNTLLRLKLSTSDPDNTQAGSEKNNFNLIYLGLIMLALILGISIGGAIVYYYSSSRIVKILKDEKNNYLNSSFFYDMNGPDYIKIVAALKKSKNDKKKEIELLNNRVAQLTKELQTIKSIDSNYKHKINSIDKNNEPIINSDIIVNEVPSNVIEWKIGVADEPSKSLNEVYFTIPENDGSFKISNGKFTKDIDSFYKIEIDKNSQKGKLFFISGEYDSRALDNIDYYLNPVCDIENITNRTHAKKIQMLRYGNVLLSSDSWKIDINHKVKIKFI